jgi:chromosomal replication initiator protein
MRDWLWGEPKTTVKEIVESVANRTGLTPEDIYGRRRLKPIVKARHAAMYLARKRAGKTSTQIGAIFGRDHTTVLEAVRKVSEAPHRYPL